MSYSPPSSAKPFTLNISDKDLSEWRQLLELSRIGPLTYEAQDDKYGVTQEWITNAKDHWLNKFDWRVQEKHINSFPNYTTEIEGLNVHFTALFSEKKDAIPIVFLHGWPGSFIEFLPLASLIREKYSAKDQPYHIIIPSLPGYTLSSGGPTNKDWTIQDTARIINTLMKGLGFNKYISQGGDIGSIVSTVLSQYEEVAGIHLNMLGNVDIPDESTLTEFEKTAVENAKLWRVTGSAYAQEHGTRPATIGFVLNSNPLSLLAWIGEKFLSWSDTTPPLDTILTNISLYWFTHSFPRSIYPYRQLFGAARNAPAPIPKPFGFSWFPKEIFPGIESEVKKRGDGKKGELVFYKQQREGGGHFAALEKPRELWGDVEEFVGKVWKQ